MSDATIIFFLSACIVVLICIVLYQQFAFRTGTQIKLKKISQKLEEIQDTDSDENVMVFTDNKVLMDLVAQINRLLENQRKVKVEIHICKLTKHFHCKVSASSFKLHYV